MSADNDNEAEEAEARQYGSDPEMEALRSEAAAMKDRALRAMAELENLRKRSERERDEARQYAITSFARALLPVADNFARALAAIPEERRAKADDTLKAVIEGVDAIQRQLQTVLESNGVKLIQAEGQRFDPNLHHAVAEVPSEGAAPGTVVNVVQSGYTIGERLLRPAMVTVAKSDRGAAQDAGKRGNDMGGSVDTQA
jgi:molecular chaperone GrpE